MPTEKRQRKKEGQRARREAALAAARRKQRQRRIITFVVIAAVVLGSLFLISLQGGGSKKKSASSDSTNSTTTATTRPTPPTSAKPPVDVPKDPAPTTLKTVDLKEGDGPAAKAGDTVNVNYVGVTYSDGKEFDSSWNRGQLFSFPLGAGQVIKGWDQGVPGMKVGGRRELIIPADLAYGDNPQGGAPKGALIFIVDLVSIG